MMKLSSYTPMLLHLVLHIGSRGVSAVLAILLFSLFARVYSDTELADIFAFGFLYGFIISTTRMIPQFAAKISGTARKQVRFQRAVYGISTLRLVIVPLSALSFYLGYHYSENPMIGILAAILFPFAVADIDLFRSAINRGSVFSLSFACGSLLALALFLYVLPQSKETAVLIIVLQWLPVGIFNYRAAWYLIKQRAPQSGGLFGFTCVAICTASFDGFIINTPFWSFWDIAESERVSFSIIIRIFASSLPLLPLLMHWANMSIFDEISTRFGISKPIVFFIMILISGLLSGIVFLLLFSVISGRNFNWSDVGLYAFLLTTFSLYFSSVRFLSVEPREQKKLLLLIAINLGIYFCVLTASQVFFELTALIIVLLQGAVFLNFTLSLLVLRKLGLLKT